MRLLPLLIATIALPALAATTQPQQTQKPQQKAPVARTAQGTGFVINTTGHIITNNHVVKHNCSSITILTPAGMKPAKLVVQDAKRDLAVIQAAYTPVRYAPLRWNITELKVGDEAATIGFPGADGAKGIEYIAKTQVIDLKNTHDGGQYIHLQNRDGKDNSGGPVLDSKGNVIGVVNYTRHQYATDAQGKRVGAPTKTDIAITLSVLEAFLTENNIRFFNSASKGAAYTDPTLHNRTHNFIVPVFCNYVQ